MKIGKLVRYKKLGRVIFGKINSRIQTLTLGNYVFIYNTGVACNFNHFWQMTE
jgi:hypothetical protein